MIYQGYQTDHIAGREQTTAELLEAALAAFQATHKRLPAVILAHPLEALLLVPPPGVPLRAAIRVHLRTLQLGYEEGTP